jgi:hypothetical protein
LLRMYRWPSTRLLLIFMNGNLQWSNSQFQERIFQITSINKVFFHFLAERMCFRRRKTYQYSGLYFLRYIFCWSPADIVYTNTLYTVYSCMFDAKEIRERVGSTFAMGFWMVFKDFPCILSM